MNIQGWHYLCNDYAICVMMAYEWFHNDYAIVVLFLACSPTPTAKSKDAQKVEYLRANFFLLKY